MIGVFLLVYVLFSSPPPALFSDWLQEREASGESDSEGAACLVSCECSYEAEGAFAMLYSSHGTTLIYGICKQKTHVMIWILRGG